MNRILSSSILVAALCTGCASNLDVRVERIQTPAGVAVEYGRANEFEEIVDRQLGALEQYTRETLELEAVLGENKNAITLFTQDARATAQDLIDRGLELDGILVPYAVTGQVPEGVQESVSTYKRDVYDYLAGQIVVWNSYTHQFPAGSEIGARIDARVRKLKSDTLPRAQRLAASKVGYQQFVVDDVFRISASDANYEFVLKGNPIPQAITSVSADAIGESTMLFVQENPTQMRIYQVETDVEKLVQNAMFIFDKSLSAAIKYLEPVPTS